MSYTPVIFNKLNDENTYKGDPDNEIDPYVFSRAIATVVDVALATNRPLLVEGEPGCGKSRLAESVAAVMGWHFLRKTVTSRTTLEELTVEMDHLQRLHDAYAGNQGGKLKEHWEYFKPGVFWWAFNHESARTLNRNDKKERQTFKGTARKQGNLKNNCVLLIDEIDKAEPDLPNDLLDTLDRRRIDLPDGRVVDATEKTTLFTVITSNGERELPPAFLRRCVTLRIQHPDHQQLISIAKEHFPLAEPEVIESVAGKVMNLRGKLKDELQRPPGTSEFLDAVRACVELEITPDHEIWDDIEQSVLIKTARDKA